MQLNKQLSNCLLLCELLAICLLLSNCNLLEAKLVSSNDKSQHKENNKADLTPLINETLAINNKSLIPVEQRPAFKDDWTFDRVEYDLMEFLQDLSARYRSSNKTNNEHVTEEESSLEAKNEIKQNTTHQELSGQQKSNNNSNSSEEKTTKLLATSPRPEIATSLASDDQEIAESSWQYGIFDRFTRPRPSTSTTPETLIDSEQRLDVRNFNNDECGLRFYEENKREFYPEQVEAAEAIKELNQRRQRIPPSRLHQTEHINKDRIKQQQQDSYDDSFKDLASSSYENSEPLEESPTWDSEFNLSSRRQWLQQQLGQTLQMLGFNGSNQSMADFLNQTSGISLNLRENFAKKSSKNLIDQPSSLDKQQQTLAARQDELKLEARVIGGSDARLGDSPWSVSLQALVSRPGTGGMEYRHYCGGTIISEHYVLTAAHCLDFMVGRESRLFVVLGDLNWRMSAASLYGRRIAIEKLIIHSGYKSTAFGHDIGLIRTRESMKPVKVNGRYIVNSVCLPEKGVEHTGEAELVGWGLFSNRNEMADSLQIADVPILPRPLCVDLYRRRTGLIQWLIGIELITDKQVCAGTFGRGICQGDSGSALVVNEKLPSRRDKRQVGSKILRQSFNSRENQAKATIIGTVAFGGIRRCSYQSLPGVYMQTSKYLDWILPRVHEI